MGSAEARELQADVSASERARQAAAELGWTEGTERELDGFLAGWWTCWKREVLADSGERQALEEIQRQPKGHNCPGYCRLMYGIACRALARGRRAA